MQRSVSSAARPRRLVVVALAAAGLVAAVATVWPARPVAGQGEAVPLDGVWRTFANGDRVNRVLRDGTTVWSATDGGGLVRWDTATGHYRQYLAPQDGLPSNDVNGLARTPDGRLWLATGRGLAVLDPGTGAIASYTPDASPGMPSRVVTAVAAAPDGTLWVGFAQEWDAQAVNPKTKTAGTFSGGGLARFDPATGRWDEAQHAVVKHSGGLGQDAPNDEYETIPSENVTVLEFGTDGILWIGTRPYYDLVARDCSPEQTACQAGYAWVQTGGGLAARQGATWQSWTPSSNDLNCYSPTINDLAADKDGRMWVATGGRGLLLMKDGLRRAGCQGGAQPYYVMPIRDTPGPRGNYVWSVDVAPDGRVWIGHGRGRDEGRGIGILQHNNTFDDSSAANQGQAWRFDDSWEFINLDDGKEDTTTVITALDVHSPGPVLLGARDQRTGDGAGLRLFDAGTRTWTALRTADTGIPSNNITSVSWNEARRELWVSFSQKGVARWDGTSWRSWRAFGAGREVAKVTLDVGRDKERIPVDMADQAAFDAAFPSTPRYVRLGGDPTLYRLTRSGLTTVGTGKYLDVTPKLQQALKKGASVFNVQRGPASDASAQVCFGADGTVWATGRETTWLGDACPAAWGNECWLDGGLGKFDGSTWTVFDQQTKDSAGKTIPDQEVQSCAVDKQGRVWVGTGNARKAEGDGVAYLDPVTGRWTAWRKTQGVLFAGNGVPGISMDPVTGDLWLAHHAAQFCEPAPFGGTCTLIRPGGGVSRWNGTKWDIWQKPAAPLAAIGTQGELSSVLVDRVAGRVWAGGMDPGTKSFHWGDGVGMNAALNWCPLDCTNAAWQHKIWPEDGDVVALAQDDRGRLWAGTHRYGNGLVPPVAGVKLYNGADWFTLTPANTGLPSNEITALARAGQGMWVGTRLDGLAFYDGAPPPATPTEPPATATPEEATPTSGPPRPTATPAEASPTPSPTRPTQRVWTMYLPIAVQPGWCAGCGTSTPATPVVPTALSPAPTDTPPPPTATATTTPSPTPVPPSATPTATRVPPTATVTATASATPTVTATRAPSTWKQYTAQSLPRVRLLSVAGLADGSAVMVGEQGQGYRWDGTRLNDLSLAASRTLHRVTFATEKQGYIAADDGFLYETRNGGQSWRVANTGSLVDDWWAVGVVSSADGLSGWLLGHTKGTRLHFDGSTWATTSADDKNTAHAYTDVAVLGPAAAMAIRGDATGARVMTWNGTAWLPGPATGPLYDLHVLAPDLGAAVGAKGTVWRLGTGGTWSAMAPKPPALGQDLNAVFMRSATDIWVAGGRTQLFHWDGKAWSAATVRVPQTPAIRSLWLSADGATGWAVGDDGVVLRYE
jgi:ligand-binding sensor domain-containing protein/photosystem II stability/assembly factor-like uncharacterized protein